MKLNEHTALSTSTVLLVPYSQHHVPPYHEWMQDPDLQAATASEPLSLEEEYAMQQSWRTDRDKLTFILCKPLPQTRHQKAAAALAARPNQNPLINNNNDVTQTAWEAIRLHSGEDDGADRMIGDINLFLFQPDADDTAADMKNLGGNCVGELELMLAKPESRRKGYGRAALLVFIDFVLAHWDAIADEFDVQVDSGETSGEGDPDRILLPRPRRRPAPQLSFLRVKVNVSNTGSIRLFESAGFVRTVEEANFFGEVELRWLPDLAALRKQGGWERAVEMEYAVPQG